MVSKVTGSLDDSGIVRSAANQSPDPTSIVGSGRCVLAIMACAVCWKKVLMENPLNVLVGNLGDFAKVSAFLFLNSVSDCTRDTGIDRLKY